MATHFTNQATNGTSTEETWAGGMGEVFCDGLLDGAEVYMISAAAAGGTYGYSDQEVHFMGENCLRRQTFLMGAGAIKFELKNAGDATSITLKTTGPV